MSIEDTDVFLEHFGIKGMHWGVRNDRPGGVSRSVNRHAEKDAKEFARAKAFYGEGAGTRRKLINATVEGKAKRMPGYKQAFDHHLSNQDPSKHAAKAVAERKRTDRKDKTKKTTGAVARRITGEMGTQAAMVALVAGGAAFFKSEKGRAASKKLISRLRSGVNNLRRSRGAEHATNLYRDRGSDLSDYLRRQGL